MLGAVLLTTAILQAVPFVPQERDTCGAAALAMVMRYWGAEVSHDEVAGSLREPELRGIRGARLEALARERGMVAIAFTGDSDLLRHHLEKGRPLVVALDAGRGRLHDVVVVGFEDPRGAIVVHDPDRGPSRRLGVDDFEKRWAASGRWTLLVTPGRSDGGRAGEAGAPGSKEAPRDEREAGAYDALVAEAVQAGQGGRPADAEAALDAAVALDPARAEAWTERAGLEFLAGRYEEAAALLRRSLALQEDAYARELLASSLHLAGREAEALAAWNRLGKPVVHAVEVSGLRRTNDRVARREIGFVPGDILTVADLRAARRRLEETGVFARVTLRPRPRGDGTADLEVALAERHGLAHGPADFLVTTGLNLAWKRVRLEYANLGGSGLSVGGAHRFQENRRETALFLRWPRPLGLDATLRAAGLRGEQAYDLGGPFELHRRGVDLGFRHVLGGDRVASFGLRIRDRRVSSVRPDAPPGLVVGLDVGLEERLVDTRRQRLEARGRLLAAPRAFGSEVRYVQADAEMRYEATLSKPEGLSFERSVVAARLRGGWGSDPLPLDEMYAPGVSPESDLPLRAHPLTRGGVMGVNPIGRSVLMLNVEWRRRLVHRSSWDLGAVVFSDAARVWRPAEGSIGGWRHDVGAGLRLSLLAGPTLRLDHAWSLTDGGRALYVGLGQAF